jgi:16S rRNA (cytosine967-C5)-methyltransferase
VLERLRKHMSDDAILELARGLQRPAPLDLRVNSLKAPREAVLDRLEFDNIAPCPAGSRRSPCA